MNTAIFVQARLNSSRLPKKMLQPLYKDKTIIYMVLQAIVENMPNYLTKVILVPYGEKQYFKEVAEEFHFDVLQGPEDDVLGRFINGLINYPNVDAVIRCCADKVVYDEIHQAIILAEHEQCRSAMTHIIDDPIRSVTAEVYSANSLTLANEVYPWREYIWRPKRGHIKPLFTENFNFWNINTISIAEHFKKKPIDISIDTEEDLERMKKLFSDLYSGSALDFVDVLKWFDKNEKILN